MNLFEFGKILEVKRRLNLILIILNFIGIFTAGFTYKESIYFLVLQGEWYLIPFVPISFILYLTMFLFLLTVYFNFKTLKFFTVFTFYINFVYGIGSVLFYPLFIIFVKGFSVYHFWNIFAHGFLGLQALFVVYYLKKLELWKYFLLGFIIFIKDLLDLFYGTFDYFTFYDFGILKYLVVGLVILLQVSGFYILFKYKNFSN